LLLINKTIAQLAKAKIYINLDIWQAFYKIWIDFNLEEFTTFYTCYKFYKCKVL